MMSHIITFPECPSDIGPQNMFKEPARYRASCDRCQNIKVRCSKDKPACKRCARKGASCIYSPIRRMGRPRNTTAQNPSFPETNLNKEDVPTSRIMSESSTPVSGSSDSHQEQNAIYTTDDTSLISVTSRSTTISKKDDGLQRDHVSSASTNLWEVSGHLPGVHERLPAQPSNSEMHMRFQDSDTSTVLHTNTHSTNREDSTGFTTDCYISILRRTTTLQHSLITAATPAPPIDLVLEAERDFQLLKQQCFACNGHTQNGRNCLQSNRSVLLSLALFAEHIITMLEETFRVAVDNASTGYTGIQDPSGISLPATAARRIERSFRGLLDLPCVFPLPAGNTNIRVGNHVVDGPVMARAVKKILQLRIRKLLIVLLQMRTMPHVDDTSNSIGRPLDWGGSRAVLDDATGLLITDLVRRMEALQGGLALIG